MSRLQLCLTTLGARITSHLAAGDKAYHRAETHYKAAGLRLREAKEAVKHTRDQTWSAFVKNCGISVRRAYELIEIAEGKTTLAEMREATRARVAACRGRQRDALRNTHAPTCSSDGQPANPPDPRTKADLLEEVDQLRKELAEARAALEAARRFVPVAAPAPIKAADDQVTAFRAMDEALGAMTTWPKDWIDTYRDARPGAVVAGTRDLRFAAFERAAAYLSMTDKLEWATKITEPVPLARAA